MGHLNKTRMDDRLISYFDSLKEETKFDRAQLIRLALYTAPFTDAFAQKIREKKRNADYEMAIPEWGLVDDDLWKLPECAKDLLGPRDTHLSYIQVAAAPDMLQQQVMVVEPTIELTPHGTESRIVIRCGSSTLVIG